MTPERATPGRRSPGPETPEQLRARITELERQLADARSSAHAGHSGKGEAVALAAMGGALLVTTPLALATLKRWIDWWRE